jgi:L-ascorbate metabolism protein UlaG (beta-lactamase superfamily)
MDGVRAAAAAAVLGAGIVIPAHYDGWTHFSEGLPQIELAFHEAGLSSVLRLAAHGTWIRLTR